MDLPPSFWELQKDIADLFTTGYFRNVLKLEVKTKTKSGIKFHFGGEEFLKYKEYLAFLEAEYEFKEYGVTFKENWNTDNVLITGITVEDWVKGVKCTCETSLFPDEPKNGELSESNSSLRQKWKFGDRMLRLETLYRNNSGCLSFESVFSASKNPTIRLLSGPLLKMGAVYNFHGLMLGCGIGVDVGSRSIFDCVAGAHFENDLVILNGFVMNARVFSTSFSQRFLDGDLESGVACLWAVNDPEIREFAVACRWKPDEDTTLRFKFDNATWIGVGVSQRIRRGVTFFLSAMAKGYNFLSGDWCKDIQVGACLELGGDEES